MWCDNCRCEVDGVPRQVRQYHAEVDTRCWEIIDTTVCPYCGEEVFEPTHCDCGELNSKNEPYCDDCINEATEAINELMEHRELTLTQVSDLIDHVFLRMENEND